MKRGFAAFRPAPILAAGLAGCTGPQHVLDPHGPAAARIAELWWVMFGLATAVSVIVAAVLLLAVHRSRLRARGRPVPEIDGGRLVWAGGVIVPAIILFGVLVYSFRVGVAVYPPLGMNGDVLEIEVVGHQFWWEVRYPRHGITTANEIHIPAGQPVRFRVSAPDVIHSFWIPRLHGKIDMIPGRIHTLWVQADEPGVFRGQCAEYCGLGHALMAFWVEAHTPAAFNEWAERRAANGPEPADPEVLRGESIFFESGCGACHATRGTPLPAALGAPGPDLSDFGARRTVAAGTLPNTREALTEWLTDPERIKPGARMPATVLPPEEMQALVTYLRSLR